MSPSGKSLLHSAETLNVVSEAEWLSTMTVASFEFVCGERVMANDNGSDETAEKEIVLGPVVVQPSGVWIVKARAEEAARMRVVRASCMATADWPGEREEGWEGGQRRCGKLLLTAAGARRRRGRLTSERAGAKEVEERAARGAKVERRGGGWEERGGRPARPASLWAERGAGSVVSHLLPTPSSGVPLFLTLPCRGRSW